MPITLGSLSFVKVAFAHSLYSAGKRYCFLDNVNFEDRYKRKVTVLLVSI